MTDQPRNQVLIDAESHIKVACEMLQREAERLRQEQEEFDSMSKKFDQVQFSSTLNSMLAASILPQACKR